MKKYIAVSLLLIIATTAASYVMKNKNNDRKTCHSEVVWIKDNSTQEGLSLKSKVTIQLNDGNQGRMNMYGNLVNHGITYRLDRAIYFDYQKIDNKGNYVVDFISSSITASDNIPDDIFSYFIELEKDKIKYYINITQMADNIFILKDESYSSFTCSL